MTNIIDKNYAMPKLSVKLQTLATLIAVSCAVGLPQLVHMIGLATGTGSSLGEILLPMHFPVLLVGFLAGTYAGFITGVFSPIISFSLTGMPGVVMLPFITIELAAYGLISGLIRNVKLSAAIKVFIAQLSGRGIRALVILAAFFGFSGNVSPAIIWTSIAVGAIGIIIQLVMIPAILGFVARGQE